MQGGRAAAGTAWIHDRYLRFNWSSTSGGTVGVNMGSGVGVRGVRRKAGKGMSSSSSSTVAQQDVVAGGLGTGTMGS